MPKVSGLSGPDRRDQRHYSTLNCIENGEVSAPPLPTTTASEILTPMSSERVDASKVVGDPNVCIARMASEATSDDDRLDAAASLVTRSTVTLSAVKL